MRESLKRAAIGLGMLVGVEGTAVPESAIQKDQPKQVENSEEAAKEKMLVPEEQEAVDGQIEGLAKQLNEQGIEVRLGQVDKHSKMIIADIFGDEIKIEVKPDGTFKIYSLTGNDADKSVSTYEEVAGELKKKVELKKWLEKNTEATASDLQKYAQENFLDLRKGGGIVKSYGGDTYDVKTVGIDQIEKLREEMFKGAKIDEK